MDLQDLGALGELIGGAAVIASVIYLAIQIRHGISGYQSNAITEATNHFSNLQMQIAQSDAVLSAWMKAEAGQALEPMEQRRVLATMYAFFIGFENLYTQCRNEVMPMEIFDARRPIISGFLNYTGVEDWWTRFACEQFPPDFCAEVDSCRVSSTSPTTESGES